MRISGRNKLKGRVVSIERDELVAKVVLDVHGMMLTSIVTCDAIDELGLKPGDEATALIKATSVMLMA